MSQYYFLVSSLPYLLSGGQAEITIKDFLSDCKSNMTAEEYVILEACKLYPAFKTGDDAEVISHPVLNRWKSWETTLRNELVKLRASTLKTDGDVFLREGGNEAGLFEAAREAVNLSDPGEAESRIDKLRWSFLDEIETGHYFDLEKLLIYYLKLQILKRQESFTPEKGNEAYRKVYESVVEQIQA
ncbi:MAG: DUF2764 family protein [Spirochaetales bacterium]|nr:DUF2764 family protein [Spirochaetales bacterium]